MEKHDFQPKEWVLVRDDDKEPWKLNIFSHKEDDDMFWCVSGWYYQCIPYEGNEVLLGKTDKPEEKKLGGWKVGDKVEVEYDTDKKWYGGEIVRIDLSNRSWVDSEAMPYYVRSECFKYNDGCAWCAARQLRKPEEKPEEEFKFGDSVEVSINGRWVDAIFLYNDESDSAPYKIASKMFGDIYWVEKKDVRRA